ncbi:hypothetical protein FYK55_17365 [Roseiconus nitratireducens]|uniref:Uncharacterized protein n=1 Tax=Roseiconus nitratireducens TaxID=2605748 RepID=A0A5M6D1J5_9BACT|nr:hypothetical protein [Roseiconus nitratireducens]KAA5541344.1 hypothetical protein FYK55_17365 [Roseiconus nitratireducens]
MSESRRSSAHRLAKQVLWMVAYWLGIGAILGCSIALRHQADPRGFVCFAIAGMMVCCLPGLVFGLFSDRPDHSLHGALGGALLGLTMAVCLHLDSRSEIVELFLLCGGIVGVTLPAYVNGLIKLASIASRRLSMRQPHSTR